jgi:nucleoside-triphosphatase
MRVPFPPQRIATTGSTAADYPYVSGSARILLEGRPGIGKTTVAAGLTDLLREAGVPLTGFLTREIRERGSRVGFSLETLAGERATLAHVNLPGPPRVGKYGVDLPAFEELAIPTLERAGRGAMAIIDELGKMELASEPFRVAALELLERPGALVATVLAGRHPFTDQLKRRHDTEMVRVTVRNRDELPQELATRLKTG